MPNLTQKAYKAVIVVNLSTSADGLIALRLSLWFAIVISYFKSTYTSIESETRAFVKGMLRGTLGLTERIFGGQIYFVRVHILQGTAVDWIAQSSYFDHSAMKNTNIISNK